MRRCRCTRRREKKVFEATVNGSGVLRVEVLRTASESTVARMIEMVTQAQAQKAPSERFSAWFGQRYTVAVLAGAVIAFAVLLLIGREFGDALYRRRDAARRRQPLCHRHQRTGRDPLGALGLRTWGACCSRGARRWRVSVRSGNSPSTRPGRSPKGRAQVVDVLPLGMAHEQLMALAAGLEAQFRAPYRGSRPPRGSCTG